MNTVTYQEYKDAFYAFAGELSMQEYLTALEDADYLETLDTNEETVNALYDALEKCRK